MTIRKTTMWLVFIVLLTAAGGGFYGFKLWNESNERIRTAILAKCAELVPEWDVSLGSARFDWNRRVHLRDITLKARGQSQQIVAIPEVVISIDRERFAQQQEVDVQKVRILGPVFDLIRDAGGKWNWQELQPPPKSKQSLPEIEIIQAMVRVRLDQSDGSQAANLSLQNADLMLIPSGKRRFLVKGLTQVSQSGKLTIDGSWDIDQGVGWFNGQMNDVASSGELSGLVIGNSPELRLKLARLEAAVDRYVSTLSDGKSSRDQNPFLVASRHTERPLPVRTGAPIAKAKTDGVPNLGASGNLDVQFRVAVKEPKSEPEFSFRVDIRQGQIENDMLPFPLRDLTGKILWDNKRFVLTGVTAKNGMTRISLGGHFDRQGEIAPGRLDISIQNLSLDKRFRGKLPPAFRKPYDSVNPGGTADLKGTLLFDGVRIWQPRDVEITLRQCTGRHIKFPYPVNHVNGTVKQRGEIFDVVLTAQAAGRPATINGYIHNPGPAAESYFAVHVDRMPIDDVFVAACNPAMKKTLAALNLEGNIAADLTMHRPAGVGQKFAIQISASVSDAAMEFVHFPYRLKSLQGDVEFNSAAGTWKLNNLRARHGNAQIAASGQFVKKETPGQLQLSITARNADIDRHLERALNPTLHKAWQQISPSGQLDLASKITWIPGQPANVTVTEATVTKGELTLSSFPYPLDDVEMSFSYANSQVDLKSLSGKHDNTLVRSSGKISWNDEGDWRVRLNELIVDDLIPDRLFRRALPADLRTVVEEIDPVGPISLDGMVEFRGSKLPQTPVTAAWDFETIHNGSKLTTGIDLEKAYGRLSTRGTWDGQRVKMTGKIDLDSVEVKGYQLTHVQGPYAIDGNKVTIGSREILIPSSNPRNRDPVPSEQRVIARAIGGVFTFDAVVDLLEEPIYRAKLTMSQGRLEQYARRYMTGAKKLAGVMDGWVDLSGRGGAKDKMTGRGQLRINPAALYEVPVVVQIVNLVGSPDKTAFRYALLDFDIANSQFLFNTIDLVGDALSLRGRGSARFDGRLNLDFYSMLPRSNLRIPIVSAVVGEATKGWVRVKVRGTTNQPETRVLAAPQVDETLKRFLGAFGTGQPTSIPRLLFAPLGVPLRGSQNIQRRRIR